MREMFPRPLFAPDGEGAGAAAAAGSNAAAGTAGTAAGAASSAWYDATEGLTSGLAPEQRTFLAGKRYPDLQTAIGSAMEADRLVRDRNVLPKPEAGKLDQWPGWTELGWNPDRNAYQIKDPKDLPPDFQRDRGWEKEFADLAHKHHVPLAAAQAMLDGVLGFTAKRIGELDASGARKTQELEGQLKRDWGPDYGQKVELSKRAMRHLGVGLDDGAELEALVGSPRMVQIFEKIGSLLGEDRLVASTGGGVGPMSASEIDAELGRQAGDRDFMAAYGDVRHANHANVRAQRERLLERKAKLAA